MLTFVYVKFEPSQQRSDTALVLNELGRPVSYEPAKWQAILHGRVHHQELDDETDIMIQDLRSRIKHCWPAGPDYPTSLNLMVEFDDERNDFSYIRERLFRLFLGSCEIGIASEPTIVDQPASAKILDFHHHLKIAS